ncbi:glycoside hydrolase family 31 protein, partial [Moorella sp. Hama-1]
GWAGIQNWPVSWSGDMLCNFPSFVCTIWGGLNYALSGVPFWSNDIGGFKGTPSPELYIRWAQFGLLSSFSRCHGTTPREPWVFGEKVLQIFKKYDELRYRLIPYLYSYAWVAAKTGLPVMRPLVLHYQEDILAREFDTEYLLGKEILVAPVTDECEERTVYLPAGKWVDFWSDEIYDGNQIIKYNAPMDKIPLFIRLNSIIPTTKVVQHIEDGVSDPLILDVYVEDRAEFTLQEAEHGVIEIVATKTDSQIDVEIPDISRNLVLRIHHCPNPTDITYNGKVLSPDVWTYQDSILTVKVIVSGLVKIRIDLITRN